MSWYITQYVRTTTNTQTNGHALIILAALIKEKINIIKGEIIYNPKSSIRQNYPFSVKSKFFIFSHI